MLQPVSNEFLRHQRKVASRELRRIGYSNRWMETALLILTIISAAAYSALLLLHSVAISELIFVFLLVSATILLYVGLGWLRRYFYVKGRLFFNPSAQRDRRASGALFHLSLSKQIFSRSKRLFAAFFYGSTIATGTFFLQVRAEEPTEQIGLLIFLFFANALTGTALFSVFQFLNNSRHFFDALEVNPWVPENKSAQIFLSLTRRLTLVATSYVSLSMVSILFSSLPLSLIVSGYVILCITIIFIIIIVPYSSVLARLNTKRREILHGIGSQIHRNTALIISNNKNERSERVFAHTKQLMELKKWLERTSYAPIRLSSLRAFISVTLISLLPIAVERLLDSGLFKVEDLSRLLAMS